MRSQDHDLIFVSFERVPGVLKGRVTYLLEAARTLRVESGRHRPTTPDVRPEQLLTFNKLVTVAEMVSYAASQLRAFRLAWAANWDVGLLATRRLHEVAMLSRWLLGDNTRLWSLVRHRLDEERQILDAFASLAPHPDHPALVDLRKRKIELDTWQENLEAQYTIVSKLPATEIARMPRWKRLAEIIDGERQIGEGVDRHATLSAVSDYRSLYKQTSAFLHSSGFSMLRPQPPNRGHWGVLLLAVNQFVETIVDCGVAVAAVEFGELPSGPVFRPKA